MEMYVGCCMLYFPLVLPEQILLGLRNDGANTTKLVLHPLSEICKSIALFIKQSTIYTSLLKIHAISRISVFH